MNATVGLIPAAGKAVRMYGLPKFLLPVKDGLLIDHLIAQMNQVVTEEIFIGTSHSNAEAILRYAPITYDQTKHYRVETRTMSETVLAARPIVGDANVIFGMGDSYWTGTSIYQRLLDKLNFSCVSAALWQVSSVQARSLGMCKVEGNIGDDEVIITKIVDKDQSGDLSWAWGALAWTKDFWQYIREDDPHVGYAVQRVIEQSNPVPAVLSDGIYFDCGTTDGYFECIRSFVDLAWRGDD